MENRENMKDKDLKSTSGTVVKPVPENIKLLLASVQRKIQNLPSHIGNSGFLQQLLNEACELIKVSDKDAGVQIHKFSYELNFYLEDGQDNLEKFYRCKAEGLTIIAKHIGV